MFLHVDPEQTLARARARDEAGGGGPLARRPDRPEGSVLHAGRADDGRLARARGLPPSLQRDGRRALRGGRTRERRQDQHGRVRDGLVHGALGLRADAQPLGSGPRARRIQRRLGCGGGGGDGPDLPRHRHGRLDPPAGRTLRRRRPEAHVRRGVALRRGRVRLVARPGRPVRTQRARLRARVLGDRGPRSVGLDLRGHARARAAARARGPARTSRRSALAGGHRGRRARRRRGVRPLGRDRARARGAGARGDARIRALATRPRGLLPDRPRRGICEPRALRRRPVRPAPRRKTTSSRCTTRRGGPASGARSSVAA